MNENRFTPALAASGGIGMRGARMAGTESVVAGVCASAGENGAINAKRMSAPRPLIMTSFAARR
jgi:hypothetical protein